MIWEFASHHISRPAEVVERLKEDWEPFAVDNGVVYFRRHVLRKGDQ